MPNRTNIIFHLSSTVSLEPHYTHDPENVVLKTENTALVYPMMNITR